MPVVTLDDLFLEYFFTIFSVALTSSAEEDNTAVPPAPAPIVAGTFPFENTFLIFFRNDTVKPQLF